MKKLYLLFVIAIVLNNNSFSQNYTNSNFYSNNNKFGSVNSKEKIYKNYFKISEDLDVPETKDQVYIDFVGTGDIQKSISEGGSINANTGLGIIFERVSYTVSDQIEKQSFPKWFQSFELEGLINIATTADTIFSTVENGILQNRRNFGAYILNPISAKQSLFINANLYFGYPEGFGKVSKFLSGVNFRVISSNNTWVYDQTNSNLGVLSFRSGIFHEFIPDNYRLDKTTYRSKYSLFLGFNYTFRGIYGDITSNKNEELRTQILGSSQTIFHGTEINFGFRLNNIRAEFQMPMLNAKSGSIEGLTDTQFLFSIKFVGGFSLKLDEKTNE
jgi:hypothetical protein